MSTKALTALVFSIVALLSVVVIVGLAQRILDATGVAVALVSLLTGIVGGLLLREKNAGKNAAAAGCGSCGHPGTMHPRSDDANEVTCSGCVREGRGQFSCRITREQVDGR